MKTFHFLTIASNEPPAYTKKDFIDLQKAVYGFIGFTYDQVIDGENHIKYLLENEKCELYYNEDIAYIYVDHTCTYICENKAKLFDFILEKDSRIEKYDLKTTQEL